MTFDHPSVCAMMRAQDAAWLAMSDYLDRHDTFDPEDCRRAIEKATWWRVQNVRLDNDQLTCELIEPRP